jgi:hypothetical protein
MVHGAGLGHWNVSQISYKLGNILTQNRGNRKTNIAQLGAKFLQ